VAAKAHSSRTIISTPSDIHSDSKSMQRGKKPRNDAMAILIRIDVDRPYGRRPVARHILSRLSSDLYFPRVTALGFLEELRTMLLWLNEARARSYVFFRRCTLPSDSILSLLNEGRHEVGVHLENSRSFATFLEEARIVDHHFGRTVRAVSKHGSGAEKFGFHHYAPYEPEKYIKWAQERSMRVFLGNLQDPSIQPTDAGGDLMVFPSAFWLEPHWRDTKRFTLDWLIDRSRHQDIVVLVHPENVLADPNLVADFKRVIATSESRIIQ
jgi:hypothetical protein